MPEKLEAWLAGVIPMVNSAVSRASNSIAVARLRALFASVASWLAGMTRALSQRRSLRRMRARLRYGIRQASAAAMSAYHQSEHDSRHRRRFFRTGLAVVILSICFGLLTYFVLTGLTPISPSSEVVLTVWLINGVLISIMVAIIAWQLYGLWRARRRQAAGAQLHVRIVSLFSVVALFPAILLAIFASISLDRGLDQWFSERTKTIVRDSVEVANSYLEEHGKTVRADAIGMARELESAAQLLIDNREAFQRYAAALAIERRLPYAFLISQDGKQLIQVISRDQQAYFPPTQEAIKNAHDGRIVDAGLELTRGVGAIKRLSNFRDLYLYVRRPVDPVVIGHLKRTDENYNQYADLLEGRYSVQVAFAMMYVVIALTLLLASIWLGLWFANRLVTPIQRLIGAAQEISKGNLDITVDVEGARSDTGQLAVTFNQMTSDLRFQHATLDERRRFIEAVLSGVTAGVIGADAHGIITLVNSTAVQLLGRDEMSLIGRPIRETIPEFAEIIAKASGRSSKPAQGQINYHREGSDLSLSVRVTQEGDTNDAGFVVTFDDITELLVAQRTSAWADVARRIAHEIKNPLTPIQLSAERIRRKYGASITSDREVFDRCTDTIIRHVGDIGRMVDEFSSFARMPKPVFEKHDAAAIVKEAVILFQMSNSAIDYRLDLPDDPVILDCDRRLLTQAVTNLVKNAGEAIATAEQSGKKEEDFKGLIHARVYVQSGRCVLEVIDNGCGLPSENRQRLTEPYVTTRQKGTGLGLAIVHRIAEQHDGALDLDDNLDESGLVTGAIVRMVIPLDRGVALDETGESDSQQDFRSAQDQANLRQNGIKQGVGYGV